MSQHLWGKHLSWVEPPKYLSKIKEPITGNFAYLETALIEIELNNKLKKVYALWRARKMITPLSSDDRDELRTKVAAYDIFHGQKPWK